eukprot:6194416-Pleurochrysis_carterae.AAC.1
MASGLRCPCWFGLDAEDWREPRCTFAGAEQGCTSLRSFGEARGVRPPACAAAPRPPATSCDDAGGPFPARLYRSALAG